MVIVDPGRININDYHNCIYFRLHWIIRNKNSLLICNSRIGSSFIQSCYGAAVVALQWILREFLFQPSQCDLMVIKIRKIRCREAQQYMNIWSPLLLLPSHHSHLQCTNISLFSRQSLCFSLKLFSKIDACWSK